MAGLESLAPDPARHTVEFPFRDVHAAPLSPEGPQQGDENQGKGEQHERQG